MLKDFVKLSEYAKELFELIGGVVDRRRLE